MFLCSLIEDLFTKEENDKTGCNFNFGHECIFFRFSKWTSYFLKKKLWIIDFICYLPFLNLTNFVTKINYMHNFLTIL